MQDLKVAMVQTDIVWQNSEQNRINTSAKINQLTQEIDIIVLPEMFSTGFSMKPESIAESMEGETVKWMQKVALDKKAAICGSVIISEENKFYNRFIFAHPTGVIEYYNKRHLFSLAGEEKVYTKGTEKLIVVYKGWKICPLVCYDLRFPVWARNVEDYDVLLYVANWPKKRITAWDTLLKARSIENMCYVVGVNRVGVDENSFEYSGHSAAYDSLGEKLTHTTPNHEGIEVVTFCKNHIVELRSKLNFLNDKDFFEVII